MKSPGSLSIFFNDLTKVCSYFNDFFSSYRSTVVLYILHVWCYPLIYHNKSNWGYPCLNVVPSTSSYSNLLSIFPSFDCINFLVYIYPFLISLDARNHDHTNIIYCRFGNLSFHIFWFVLILNDHMDSLG